MTEASVYAYNRVIPQPEEFADDAASIALAALLNRNMGGMLTARDFHANPNEVSVADMWTGGKIRHVRKVIGDGLVIVAPSDGLMRGPCRILGVSSDERRVSIWHRYGPGPTDAQVTSYLLADMGPIVPLCGMWADGDIVRSYRAESLDAVMAARRLHGEAEGRAWGRWNATPGARFVYVEYRPYTENVPPKETPGGAWLGQYDPADGSVRQTYAQPEWITETLARIARS